MIFGIIFAIGVVLYIRNAFAPKQDDGRKHYFFWFNDHTDDK